jgi:hypothetical protein
MSKIKRRKKAKPVKNRRMTFRISVEAQPVVVRYQPNWMDDMAHFEFWSPYRPPRRIPIGTSGYYSHFAAMEDVKAAKSPERYAGDAKRFTPRLRSQRVSVRCPSASHSALAWPRVAGSDCDLRRRRRPEERDFAARMWATRTALLKYGGYESAIDRAIEGPILNKIHAEASMKPVYYQNINTL